MGLLGIVRGAVKTIEGVVEGDGEKIVQGIGRTIKGVVTTVAGGAAVNDDDDDDD